MKEWYEGCISDGAVRVINRVHYCGSACTTCQVQAAFDMRGTCVTPDTWHMQPIFHTLESSRFWVLLLLEPQSGALRIGAYRDFHPTQISTYSFCPFKPVCIIHYTFLQCAVCTELLWSLQLWARLAQSAARGVGLIWPKLWRRAVAQIMFMSIIFQPGSVTHPNPANQRPREQAATNQGAS